MTNSADNQSAMAAEDPGSRPARASGAPRRRAPRAALRRGSASRRPASRSSLSRHGKGVWDWAELELESGGTGESEIFYFWKGGQGDGGGRGKQEWEQGREQDLQRRVSPHVYSREPREGRGDDDGGGEAAAAKPHGKERVHRHGDLCRGSSTFSRAWRGRGRG
jgi:hypothetical protein